ncbi:unnamed protein product [Paramecium octaurelia]|uniref:TLDc domain-containing protein n=1 Tax=Paramecium octaurelia TaxID=43137 RepID=A0A8S1YPI6_PAROT|nr:unnamed protein product [Paramecium octaurelia]
MRQGFKAFFSFSKLGGREQVCESCLYDYNILPFNFDYVIKAWQLQIGEVLNMPRHIEETWIFIKFDFWIKIFCFTRENKENDKKLNFNILRYKKWIKWIIFLVRSQQQRQFTHDFSIKSEYIFEVYSPCKWVSNLNNYGQYDSLQQFILSQTHNQIYSLKQDRRYRASYCNSTFGGGHGYCKLGDSYRFDQYQNQGEHPHLYGQNKSEIKECEIYEISFI